MRTLVKDKKLISFYKIIENHAVNSPNRIALKHDDESILYSEFFEFCKRVAGRVLKELKKHPHDITFIPIVFERSHYVPITIHGLQFINKAYVPLDPTLPEERLRFLLQDIASPIVITQAKYKEKLEML